MEHTLFYRYLIRSIECPEHNLNSDCTILDHPQDSADRASVVDPRLMDKYHYPDTANRLILEDPGKIEVDFLH
jgi:hypothetical protein